MILQITVIVHSKPDDSKTFQKKFKKYFFTYQQIE